MGPHSQLEQVQVCTALFSHYPSLSELPLPAHSDEIYALSVWGENAPKFQSLECIAREEMAAGRLTFEEGCDGGASSRSRSGSGEGGTTVQRDGEARLRDLLHVVFGLSKDFCASGLRFGALHR